MSTVLLLILALCASTGFAKPEDSSSTSTTEEINTSANSTETTISENEVSSTREVEATTTESTVKITTAGGDARLERLEVRGLVRHRYATLDVYGKMVNHGDTADESHFVVHLPESAFVTRATLIVNGRRMDGEVREKKIAQQEYQQAVNAGLSAGHVFNVRDSNQVRVSVNLHPGAKATFNLTYEELLVRRKGRYEVIFNISPDQPVEHICVDLKIRESTNITFVHVPPFDSPLAPDGTDDTRVNAAVNVTWPEDDNGTRAHVYYSTRDALPGPLIVRYDVDRTAPSGEVLLMDGYFVHFLAATPEREAAEPLPKHAVFVLDSSGSMWGRKLQQLKDAMAQILGQLRRHDVFSIVTFSTSAAEWTTPGLEPAAGKGVYVATRRNIALAQEFINRMEASGATNIMSALRRSLVLAARYRNTTVVKLYEGVNYTSTTTEAPPNAKKVAQPVLMFLTDGMPTAGELRLNRILNVVKFFNQVPKASIFALAFGDGANLGFLRKLSLQNSGFSRRIYEAADSALQLQSFYQEVASPLLTNINFTYVDSKVNLSSVTERHFPTFFAGSEAVVAGRLQPGVAENNGWDEIPTPAFSIMGHVTAQSTSQILHDIFMPTAIIEKAKHDQKTKKRRPGHLERAWAYLTVRQLLDAATLEEDEADEVNITAPTPAPIKVDKGPKAIALSLALKYGFVTPLTSLVLIERNITNGTKKEAILDVEGTNFDSGMSAGMNVQDKVIPSVNPMVISGARPGPRPAGPIGVTSSTTTTSTTTSQPDDANWIESLPWLKERLQADNQLSFTIDNEVFNRTIVFDIISLQNQQTASSCVLNSNETGRCRHLVECHSQLTTYEIFLEKFCDIAGKFVGVCCNI